MGRVFSTEQRTAFGKRCRLPCNPSCCEPCGRHRCSDRHKDTRIPTTQYSDTYKITVLKGFTYDRASIPRIFWVIIDKDSLGNVAPLLHDLLYRNGGLLPTNQVTPYRKFSRKETDDLFLEVATKCGVSKWRRDLVYQVVRNFGGSSWKEQQLQ
jgi:hypothetical protein